ncbi:MAG: hypothetical protein BJ554DRAFT_4206, partial [Olpidium bornovanus]
PRLPPLPPLPPLPVLRCAARSFAAAAAPAAPAAFLLLRRRRAAPARPPPHASPPAAVRSPPGAARRCRLPPAAAAAARQTVGSFAAQRVRPPCGAAHGPPRRQRPPPRPPQHPPQQQHPRAAPLPAPPPRPSLLPPAAAAADPNPVDPLSHIPAAPSPAPVPLPPPAPARGFASRRFSADECRHDRTPLPRPLLRPSRRPKRLRRPAAAAPPCAQNAGGFCCAPGPAAGRKEQAAAGEAAAPRQESERRLRAAPHAVGGLSGEGKAAAATAATAGGEEAELVGGRGSAGAGKPCQERPCTTTGRKSRPPSLENPSATLISRPRCSRLPIPHQRQVGCFAASRASLLAAPRSHPTALGPRVIPDPLLGLFRRSQAGRPPAAREGSGLGVEEIAWRPIGKEDQRQERQSRTGGLRRRAARERCLDQAGERPHQKAAAPFVFGRRRPGPQAFGPALHFVVHRAGYPVRRAHVPQRAGSLRPPDPCFPGQRRRRRIPLATRVCSLGLDGAANAHVRRRGAPSLNCRPPRGPFSLAP